MSEERSTALKPFNKLDAGLAALKEDYAKVPDFKTKEGYEVGRANLVYYRDIKKRVRDTYDIAVEDIVKTKKMLLAEKNRIIEVVEETFEPHQKARKAEDERQATIKREKEEAKARRDKEIQDRIDAMRESYAQSVSLSSSQIKDVIDTHKDKEITEELFGDDIEVAKAIHSALTGKLQILHDSKKEQEAESERIRIATEELEVKQEAQRIEDEKRADETRKKDEADRQRMEEENAKLKAENESLQAERKKLDDERAVIEAEKQKLTDAKLKAEEEAELVKQMQIEKDREEQRQIKLAEEKAERELQEKKDREEAERQAEKDMANRLEELHDSVYNLVHSASNAQVEDLIIQIGNKEIPYLRLDWTQK